MSINYYEAGIYWVLEAKGKTLGSSVWGRGEKTEREGKRKDHDLNFIFVKN